MATTKRATEGESKQRKSKKPRTNRKQAQAAAELDSAPAPLGATSLLAQHAQDYAKDETELQLEEAVFGRRAGTRDADVYDLAEEDFKGKRRAVDGNAGSDDEIDYEAEQEDDDDEETGLERLRDDNVGPLSLFTQDPPLDPYTLAHCGNAALFRRRAAHSFHVQRRSRRT